MPDELDIRARYILDGFIYPQVDDLTCNIEDIDYRDKTIRRMMWDKEWDAYEMANRDMRKHISCQEVIMGWEVLSDFVRWVLGDVRMIVHQQDIEKLLKQINREWYCGARLRSEDVNRELWLTREKLNALLYSWNSHTSPIVYPPPSQIRSIVTRSDAPNRIYKGGCGRVTGLVSLVQRFITVYLLRPALNITQHNC